jgi:hypothetical protein
MERAIQIMVDLDFAMSGLQDAIEKSRLDALTGGGPISTVTEEVERKEKYDELNQKYDMVKKSRDAAEALVSMAGEIMRQARFEATNDDVRAWDNSRSVGRLLHVLIWGHANIAGRFV